MQLVRDAAFYAVGIVFLGLAKAKNILRGYSSPKPFDISDSDRCIAYDLGVVEHWLSHLRKYAGGDDDLAGKTVLELGPGSDLGVGLCLLAKGCARYNACDVHDLMKATPDAFYERLFAKLGETGSRVDADFLRDQLREARAGRSSLLEYVVREDFDLVDAFGEGTVDLVFSQAAFEHFDDVETTVARLTAVCRPGAVLVAEIDLKTHSRWIRDKDPNNIYRYPEWLYGLFRFRGSPNRVRPFRYREAFERLGWTDVSITPRTTLPDGAAGRTGLARAFADERNRMDWLTVMLCARKGRAG